jgi:glyoxylase-like metal-dependent hydrolase (beta-lactamase superfamily II)
VRVQVQTIVSQPFAENSYVLWRDGAIEAVVVDPGFEPEVILEFLSDRGLTLVAIVNTHGHVDHIAGNRALKEAFPAAPVVIGHGDADMLLDPELNLSAGFGIPVTSPPKDQAVREGDELTPAGIPMTCREVPGHSPGHVVYFIEGTSPPMLLGGDVLFRGGVGRWDFPGGDFDQLAAGIRGKLWPLPAETVVYPGHGPVTTIGHERRTNPFVGEGV